MEFLKARGTKIYAGQEPILLRGFGLGGWFLPEGYMWKLYEQCDRPRKMEAMIEELCSKEYSERFWECYLERYITREDIKWISLEGFNSIRLPLNSRHLYQRNGDKLVVKEDMFQRIDRLISWCREFNIYVILDMHGAPGGQTGQNIDDSEQDIPELFIKKEYEEELVFLWKELVKRYHRDSTVAGYDLLNEPLPNFFQEFNFLVLPLYRRLIREIREIDQEHMIILEGVHWATDFSIFQDFTMEEAADNILLQFHKYWSNPDEESLQEFIRVSQKLNVPLFMGEGGENNCDWYTTAFPLYEQLNISWSFWSYKKMDCNNSPISFKVPEGWDKLKEWIDRKTELTREEGQFILDNLLDSISNSWVNRPVLNALKREPSIRIPCEAYQKYKIASNRVSGAELRMNDPVTILFENGKTGKVDYQRMGGEEQPPEDNLVVQLLPGDEVGYKVNPFSHNFNLTLVADGAGILMVSMEEWNKSVQINGKKEYSIQVELIQSQDNLLWLSAIEGRLLLDCFHVDI